MPCDKFGCSILKDVGIIGKNTFDFNLVLSGFGYSFSEESLGPHQASMLACFMKVFKTIQKG